MLRSAFSITSVAYPSDQHARSDHYRSGGCLYRTGHAVRERHAPDYNSFDNPIVRGVVALLALFLTHNELNVIGMIAIILLIGLVKKNAIMMIDVALDVERNERKKPVEAIYDACILRFRPIMMTTTAAMLGGLPLALETGTGSELHRPSGITIVGGLIVSQMLTLFTTPVVYVFLDRLRLFVRGRTDEKLPETSTSHLPAPHPAD